MSLQVAIKCLKAKLTDLTDFAVYADMSGQVAQRLQAHQPGQSFHAASGMCDLTGKMTHLLRL